MPKVSILGNGTTVIVSGNGMACGGDMVINGRRVNVSDQPTLDGSGRRVTAKRTLQQFNAIDVRCPGLVKIVDGLPGASIAFDDNLIDRVATSVRNGVLRVEIVGAMSFSSYPIVEISCPRGSLMSLAGSNTGEVRWENIGGSSVKVELSGTLNALLAGVIGEATLAASGACSIDARNLESSSCRVNLSGACHAQIHAVDELDAELSGACTIYVRGRPARRGERVSGVSKVIDVDQ